MVDTLALENLVDRIQARFTADGTTAAIAFGWKEPAKQVNQGPGRANRIVFVPGDPNGAIGEVGPAKYPGRNPRPLGTLGELVTVYVWAYDATAPTNERSQYGAARRLFDAWYRAAYIAMRGHFRLVSTKWVTGKTERPFGAEIEAVIAIESEIPDTPWQTPPVTVAHTSNSIALIGGVEVCCES